MGNFGNASSFIKDGIRESAPAGSHMFTSRLTIFHSYLCNLYGFAKLLDIHQMLTNAV
jgi:hypothetical protein